MNVLAAFSDVYGILEGMAQDRARRAAGNALAKGDYGGAQAALYRRGMISEGQGVGREQMAMQDRQQAQQQRLTEQQKAEAEQRVEFLQRATQALRRLPPEQRQAALQSQVLPILSQYPGFDEQMLAQVAQSDLSDQTLDGFLSALGTEAQKWQLFQSRTGDIIAVNPNDPTQQQVAYDAPEDPNAALEADYLRARIAATQAQVPLRQAQTAKAGRPPAPRPAAPAAAPRSYGSGAEPVW
jgi:hypothetical protein